MVGVVQCVDGLGTVAEGGVFGVDDASCGAPVVGPPQGQGALGVLYHCAVLQLHIALGVVPVGIGILVGGAVAPDFDAGPHVAAQSCQYCAIVKNQFATGLDDDFGGFAHIHRVFHRQHTSVFDYYIVVKVFFAAPNYRSCNIFRNWRVHIIVA